LPARLFDDTEELSAWARTALAAAQRAAIKKRPKARKTAKVAVKKAAAKKPAVKRMPAKKKSAKKR
jgi:DNA transformation protein